jgi:hypothetical protein
MDAMTVCDNTLTSEDHSECHANNYRLIVRKTVVVFVAKVVVTIDATTVST